MKKILAIIILIFVFVTTFYFIKQNNLKKVPLVSKEKTLTQQSQVAGVKEVQIGDMVFGISSKISSKVSQNSLMVEIVGTYAVKSEINDSQINFPIYILYNKDWNEENLPLREWFNINGPQTEKTSATSFYDKEKITGNISYLESLYKAPTSMYRSDYYDVVLDYLNNKTDIYTIVSYRNPDNSKKPLTPEEQKSIENYEKIVNQIIQSTHFVH